MHVYTSYAFAVEGEGKRRKHELSLWLGVRVSAARRGSEWHGKGFDGMRASPAIELAPSLLARRSADAVVGSRRATRGYNDPRLRPFVGRVLAVVGTGERALLRYNTHTHTTGKQVCLSYPLVKSRGARVCCIWLM